MKKMPEILKDIIKTIIGGLAFVGTWCFMIVFEMREGITITASEAIEWLESTLMVLLIGIGSSWVYIRCSKVKEDSEKDVVEKTKETIKIAWINVIIIITIICLVTKAYEGLILLIIFSGLYGGVLLIAYLMSKKSIKEINEKIKEKNK